MNLKTVAAATLMLTSAGLIGFSPRTAHADPVTPIAISADTVDHGTDDYYHIRYSGGEQGDVHVAADDDSDNQYLEIKVYDPDGNLVARDFGDEDHSPHAFWQVDSSWDWRQYTIKVVNLSYHDIPYAIHFF